MESLQGDTMIDLSSAQTLELFLLEFTNRIHCKGDKYMLGHQYWLEFKKKLFAVDFGDFDKINIEMIPKITNR